MTQSDEQEGISPGLFKSQVAKGHSDFSTNQQQDAAEFLLYLFGIIEKEAKKANRPDPTKLFEFQFEERLQLDQNHVTYKNVPEVISLYF